MLQYLAGGTSVMVAGCIGGNDDPDETPTDEGNGNGSGGRSGTYSASVTRHDNPADVQFNRYNPNRQYELHHGIEERYMVTNARSGEITPVLFESYDRSGGEMTFTLRENHTWHNGDEVTSEDVEIHFALEREFGADIWSLISELTVDDEKTVTLTLQNAGQSTESVLNQIGSFSFRMGTPRAVYGEYYEQLTDATTQDETDSVLADLTEMQLDDPIGCGIWKLASIDEQGFLFDIHEGHFASENIQYAQGQRPVAPGGGGAQERVVLEGITDLDSTQNIEVINQADSRDDLGLTTVQQYAGRLLAFNPRRDDLYADRRFKKAIMRLIDREHVWNLFGPLVTPASTPCGIMPSHDLEEVLPNIHDKLQTNERDVEEGKALLREVGCTEEDGDWYRPDGDPLSFKILGPAPSNLEPLVDGVVNSLQREGFDAEPDYFEFSQYASRFVGGDWDLAADSWLNAITFGDSFNAFLGYRGKPFTEMVDDETGEPAVVEVPPVGEPDSDDTIEVAYIEDMQKLSTELPEDERIEIRERLAWTYNQSLPLVPYVQEAQSFVWDTTDWEFPAPDHDVWGIPNPFYMLGVLEGYPRPK